MSANFQVCSLGGVTEPEAVARYCEETRSSLARRLELAADPWRPKCQVILYPTMRSYTAAVGPGAEVTIGSSLVKPTTGKIASRRIDLRTDVPNFLQAALPHEMCHLLVADRFRERPAPLWYDEGLAILADQPAKLQVHHRDLCEGIRRRTLFRLSELLAVEAYPAADRMGVFYGQCAALTQRLLELRTPAQVHRFVSIIPSVGVNDALRSTYDIDGLAELERMWANADSVIPLRSVASLLPTQNAGERFGFASVMK